MGRAARELGYEYLAICDHTRNVTRRTRARRRRHPPAGARRSLPRTSCSRRSGSCAGASATSSRTARSTFPTTCSRSSTGCRSACMRASGGAARRSPTASSRRCAIRPLRCLSHPKGRILNHRPENALDLDRVFEVALETGVALEVNGLPDRLDLSRHARARSPRGGGPDRLLHRRALDARARRTWRSRSRPPRRGGAPRGAVLNTLLAGGAPRPLRRPGPRSAYSCTSYQCVSRSASATSESVCPA